MGRESYILAAPSENSPPPPPPRSSPAPAPAPTALAPGFRFHPTDEELVIYYLKRKVCGKPFRFNAITEVDVYKCEPWDLSDKYSLKSRDQEYYFFSALDRKYGNGARMNRATMQGYWKATGNDRPVKHESRTVGLKKTLVFHSGRAPDGKRTNWVMHEYRIVDEELDRAGVGATQDAFVLCRIFHKSNIGPPSGQRYAPFIEEEWDDDEFTMVIPGMNNREELGANRTSFIGGNSHNTYVERTSREKYGEGTIVVQDTQGTKRPAIISKALDLPEEEEERDLPECKVEKPDDPQPLCVVNRDERYESCPPPPPPPLPPPGSDTKQNIPVSVDHHRVSSPLLMYKRRRHNDANGSTSSSSSVTTTTTSTTAVSTTTTAATATAPTTTTTTKQPPPTTRNFLSALVEYSLLESVETKDSAAPAVVVPPELEAANLDSALPPSCIKFIQDLQSEIHQVSIERDTLKFEMMSSQAMINILQSRIDLLSKELSELKGKRRG